MARLLLTALPVTALLLPVLPGAAEAADTCDVACDPSCVTCCSSWSISLTCTAGEVLERRSSSTTHRAAAEVAAEANAALLACVGSTEARCLAASTCSERWRLPEWIPTCDPADAIINPALARRLTGVRDAELAAVAEAGTVLEGARSGAAADATLARQVEALAAAHTATSAVVASMGAALGNASLTRTTVDELERGSPRRKAELARLSAAVTASVVRGRATPRPTAPAAVAAPTAEPASTAQRDELVRRLAEIDTAVRTATALPAGASLLTRSRALATRARVVKAAPDLRALEPAVAGLEREAAILLERARRVSAATAPIVACEIALPPNPDLLVDGVRRPAGAAPVRLAEGWHRLDAGGRARRFLVLCDRPDRLVTAP